MLQREGCKRRIRYEGAAYARLHHLFAKNGPEPLLGGYQADIRMLKPPIYDPASLLADSG